MRASERPEKTRILVKSKRKSKIQPKSSHHPAEIKPESSRNPAKSSQMKTSRSRSQAKIQPKSLVEAEAKPQPGTRTGLGGPASEARPGCPAGWRAGEAGAGYLELGEPSRQGPVDPRDRSATMTARKNPWEFLGTRKFTSHESWIYYDFLRFPRTS